MGNLIKFECRKLFNHASFYICLAVTAALQIMDLVLNVVMKRMDGVTAMSEYDFGNSFLMPSSYTVVLAIFFSIFICQDFTADTMKNIISRGYTRSNVFRAKYIVTFIATLLFYAASIVIGYVGNAIFWGIQAIPVTYMCGIILLQILILWVYQTLFVALSMVFRRQAASIALGIIIPIIYNGLLTGLLFIHESGWLNHLYVSQKLTDVINLGEKFSMNDIIGPGFVCIGYVLVLLIVGFICSKRTEY